MTARPDTYAYWLARAAKQLRKQASVNQVQIASAAGGMDPSTVHRFEEGGRYPQKLDLILAAYAEKTGLEDSRGIYELALELWLTHGNRPALADLLDAPEPRSEGDALARARDALSRSLNETKDPE